MNPIDDATLQAYVDGELDAAARARVDALLAQDPAQAHRVQQLQALNAQLRAAFDPVLDEPVPAHLTAMLQPRTTAAATPTSLAGRRRTHAAPHHRPRRWMLPGAALAASVALLAVGLWWHAGNGLVRTHNGESYAAGALVRALDQSLASEPDAQAPVAIGLSFRAADGHICRTFTIRTPPSRSGLACRAATGWALPVIAPMAPVESGELRQAASDLPPTVQAAVDARLHGNVFNARQERAARAAGWR
ncbi:MAG: hypothetical protein EPN56_11150 [Rhodanobacter sp.]|nr:MAG: hypothetical protein EPN78_12665 [Rhodanobacter sp.]TAM13148.1 MAG: hypothetical protein EPN66_06340 [Rhodanobacter sp.]TAM35149.1 MAG: hypothetical protein EPN56_11150 [Rhodanobacter sp.]